MQTLTAEEYRKQQKLTVSQTSLFNINIAKAVAALQIMIWAMRVISKKISSYRSRIRNRKQSSPKILLKLQIITRTILLILELHIIHHLKEVTRNIMWKIFFPQKLPTKLKQLFLIKSKEVTLSIWNLFNTTSTTTSQI